MLLLISYNSIAIKSYRWSHEIVSVYVGLFMDAC